MANIFFVISRCFLYVSFLSPSIVLFGCQKKPMSSTSTSTAKTSSTPNTSDFNPQDVRELIFYFDDLHLFHRSGCRLWLDEKGRMVFFRWRLAANGTIEQGNGMIQLSEAELSAIRDRIDTVQLPVVKNRPGVPDEVPVHVWYRNRAGILRSFFTWEQEWRGSSPGTPNPLREITEDLTKRFENHLSLRILSSSDKIQPPPWPSFIRKLPEKKD